MSRFRSQVARRSGELLVPVPTEVASKAALAIACRRSELSQAALARILDIDQETVSQMLNPRHTTDAASINRALRILGSELVLEVRSLAAVNAE